jgi:membrane associated rhomboid family serine protease
MSGHFHCRRHLMSNARLDKLVWLLIYSGMLLAIVGLWALAVAPAIGTALAIAGALDAATGAALLWWRSRRPDDPSTANEP